jgi:hypothetical protein
MGLVWWTALLFWYGFSAYSNYKKKSIEMAMLCSFATGLSLVFLAYELIEFYTK